MLELLEKLCSIGGVSGREDKVREFIIFEIDGFADWRVCTSLIAGFMAKEAVVSTLGVLTGGAGLSTLFSVRSAAAFLVFTLLYTPCVAAVAAIRRELDSAWKTFGVVVFQCLLAWGLGAAVYQIALLI